MSSVRSGLDGIVVADTELSDVDGERGHLVIRGCDIEDLVGRVTFEDVCGLLWSGRLPSATEREELRAQIAAARGEAFARLPSLEGALELPDGMDALRAALAHLSASGDVPGDAHLLTGATAVFAAAWARRQRDQLPVEPDRSMSHAADYLHMIAGAPPPAAHVQAVDEREAETLLAERHPERNLRANVEFYTAVLLEAAGIPRALFSPTFAASRVAGWCAHYDEQRRRGRLMRPLSNYIGPRPMPGT